MPSATPAPVIVNVYDLADFNAYLNWCGMGAYHSGLQVHGREFAFGAHPYECSGIFDTAPLEAPGDVTFRTSIYVGDTYYTAEELDDMIAHMGREYLGRRYHLLQTNCNSFTSDACFALCGERPPGWINRLAGIALAVHCLCPTSWVPPLQPPSMMPNFDDLPSAPERVPGPVGESRLHAPSHMERIGAEDSFTVTMPRHGRSRSMGKAGGITRTTDTAPRGISPGQGAISSTKTLSIARVSNVSRADGDSEGVQATEGSMRHGQGSNRSRRKKDGREHAPGPDMSALLDYDE